jgi:hypothetical protein
MPLKSIGGGDVRFSAVTKTGQEGVYCWGMVKDGSGRWQRVWQKTRGLNNIGMLVRSWGKFTYIDPYTFTIDDGSDIRIKCTVPEGVILQPSWAYVCVTGIIACERPGTELKPVLRLSGQADLTPIL